MTQKGSPHRPLQALATTALVLVLKASVAAPAEALPRTVILLRHGDKVAAGDGNYNLSVDGFLRSITLARLIPACFGPPTQIRTFFLNPESSKNARSYQSAVPLGVATGVNISIAQSSRDNSFLDGQEILSQPTYEGGTVVLFWEHRRMPELARGLGWASMKPIGATEFGQIFVLRYSKPGVPPKVEILSQRELFETPCFREARSPLPAVPLPR
ncbi:hypothetical protein KQ313_01895 [Synechococcus sp. CS-1325]|nr:hypothetical protein [Synechococcus sp. CS-1325]MCT0198440.1 hypothetical protein [Synechococcus sp. CS-1325]MCT0213560.1 hypothetical protein [Synechococcus sp. CS-1326]MCT0232151.1 hypothetical protein [Synechococcus sp. CS-1327]PZU99191.1 MAG: hypothetical protein DCF24_09530 [Cyanobium sp.]